MFEKTVNNAVGTAKDAFELELKKVVAAETDVLEKAGMIGKALVDYTREQLKGSRFVFRLFGREVGEIGFESHETERATAANS